MFHPSLYHLTASPGAHHENFPTREVDISLSFTPLLVHPWFQNVIVLLYVLGFCPSGLV